MSSASSSNSSAPGGSSVNSAAASGPGVDEAALVYHISLFVIALIALLSIVRLPRLAFRLFRWSEISQGHLLRRVSFSGSPRVLHLTHDRGQSEAEQASNESHTYYQHATHIERLDEKGGHMVMNAPSHIPSCPASMRGFASELSTRIIPGYSLAQAICGLVYLAAWIYPTFYKSNPFSNPIRTGWVGIAQLPFIFAFAGKNNALGPFLGMGYEKVSFVLLDFGDNLISTLR